MTTQKNGATARTVSPEKQPGRTTKLVQLTLFPVQSQSPQKPLTAKEVALLITLEDETGLSKERIISYCGDDFYKTIINLRKKGFGITCQIIKGEWRYALKSWPKGVSW